MIISNTNDSREKNINAAVLGATGLVGQVFVHLLAQHPWFNLALISGSASRTGKTYGNEVQWLLPEPLPESAFDLELEALDIDLLNSRNIKIIFSALPAEAAHTIEPLLRENHFYVFSNASALRYEPGVPILIPEVNPEALKAIEEQGFPGKGFVVTNANCSTTGLATALAPLKKFGLREIFVSTYQSVSGAGYPGLSALDIMGNTIPYIAKEEEKMQAELKKILQIEADIYPFCVRVPVLFGHLETVWLTTEKTVNEQDILDAWQNFRFDNSNCPTLPEKPVVYIEDRRFPQPRMSFWGSPAGMQVFTGRLRKQGDKTGFTLLVNNLVKGAAGCTIANAELFISAFGDQGDSFRENRPPGPPAKAFYEKYGEVPEKSI
jgi:aspartate-semialdehyde dehydrogenase